MSSVICGNAAACKVPNGSTTTSAKAQARGTGLCSVSHMAGQKLVLSNKKAAARVAAQAAVAQARDVRMNAVSTEAPATPVQAPTMASRSDKSTEQSVLGIILGGGAGSRLYPLTKKRAKPAVPLGGNYRLIDIPVSNCLNSNITKVYCLTQFNSASLNRHLSQAYNSNVGGHKGGFVEVLAAQQSPTNPEWFQGTADAVRQYLWLFEEAVRDGVEDYVILSGDHLYRMDYEEFVMYHREKGADITVGALPMDEARAEAFGLMKIDDTGRIIDFAEKPKGDALKAFAVDTTVLGLSAEKAEEMPYIASMGIYVFKASAMLNLLESHFPEANDFGSEVIPGAKDMGMHVQAYLFDGYWEDIGTISAFYHSNLALTEPDAPKFSFYDKDGPIYTMSRYLPPSKVLDCDVTTSIIGDGCKIKDCKISHSVVGLRSIVNSDCVIEDALLMGADYYEQPVECELLPGCLPIGIGAGTTIRKAIVDKNARIGENCQIINKDNVKEDLSHEAEGWVIKDGIVVIIKDAIIPAGTIV